MPDLKRIFACTHSIIEPDKLHVRVLNIATNALIEETITIDDPKLLSSVDDIIAFPLEELEYGLLSNHINIREIVDGVIAQVKQTRTNSPSPDGSDTIH